MNDREGETSHGIRKRLDRHRRSQRTVGSSISYLIKKDKPKKLNARNYSKKSMKLDKF